MAAKREHDSCGDSQPPRKRVKENYKRVTGKLLSKMTISLENQLYYTFTFRLGDNKTEAYYGNLQCFRDLVEQECYDVSLNFVKSKFKERIEINEYCKSDAAMDEQVSVKQYLTRADFENEDMVNALAKLKCVFKRLGANNYKLVFDINVQDAGGAVFVQQIECVAGVNELIAAVRAHVGPSKDLNKTLDFYFKNTDKLFNVHGVRCQHTSKAQNEFLSWKAGPLTTLETALPANDEDYANLVHGFSVNNISRANKHLKSVPLARLKAEQKTSDTGKNSFSVQFKSSDSVEEDDSKWSKCVYYVDSVGNGKDEAADAGAMQKLAMDFDQLATCLSDGLTKATIFVTADIVDPTTMNLLGLLKYDDDEDPEYNFL